MDYYRVMLFKRKIKDAIPGGEHIRFGTSHDESHLIISMWPHYYGKEHEVAELVSKNLKKSKIDHAIKLSPFKFQFGNSDRPWCVSIPIDQEALPERKRRA